MRCNFQGVTLPCTFTRQTLVRFASGFSRRPFKLLSFVTKSRPSELKSNLPTVIRCPYREKLGGKSQYIVRLFCGSRCVHMYPLGLLIIQSFVMGFCTCSPTGVKAFKLAYTGTSVFSKTLFPSTRTRPNLMNYSASLREHIALRLIHFDNRTISYWGLWGVLTISPKARICLHSSNLIVIIIIHFGDKVMQIRKAIYRGRVCSWSFSSFMRL